MKEAPRLLLVEDSEDDMFFFQRALRKARADCRFTHLANGAIAIDFLKALNRAEAAQIPDLIFLDLKMPVLSGFDVLNWMRQEAPTCFPRVIVLSGSDHAEDKRRALSLGAFDYLVKPIRPQELTAYLEGLDKIESPKAGVHS